MTGMNRTLFIALFLFAFTAVIPALAAPGDEPPTRSSREEKHAPKGGPEIVQIEVQKKLRRMYLYDKDGKVIHTYHISLGRNPEGHKQQEGDSRTPEGNYEISGRNGLSGYYRSLKISYPNKDDIARAKEKGVSPGGNIFIHGKPNFKFWMFWKYNKVNDWTDGCIAVDDKDMMEMWDIVKPGTPILINP